LTDLPVRATLSFRSPEPPAMKRALAWTTLLVAATTVTACGRSEPESTAARGDADDSTLTVSIGVGSLGFSRDSVRIRPEGVPEARIFPGGRLVIGGDDVPVNDEQRALLVAYHDAAMQLREQGKQTGIAGAKVGVAAVGAVISGLAQGDPDSIGPKVEAEAEKVKQAALKLCEDMAMMRQAQEALAVDLEAFRPYATIKEDDVTDCRHGVDSNGAPASPGAPPAQEVAPVKEEPTLI
jgi:hypothetical protein